MALYTRCLCLITLIGLVQACGVQRPETGSPEALIGGTISAGPISPVSRVGHPNTRPVQGASVEALHGTEVVAVAHTDHAGHYELKLRPGTYAIQATSDRYRFARPQPKIVTVSAGERETINFVLDTGIR
jgi:hypothetical protein